MKERLERLDEEGYVRVKYPRTPHLPWSEGMNGDDRMIESTLVLESSQEVVVTEKMDGENTTLYADGLHARSLQCGPHPSRSWVKRLQGEVGPLISEGMRVCGENVYAVHSIEYRELPSYFLVFSIYEEGACLSWDETVEWCALFGLQAVPVLYRGRWAESGIRDRFIGRSRCGGEQEGYVVRVAGRFTSKEFALSVAKFVRAGHVQSEEHWMNAPLRVNSLGRTAHGLHV